MDKARWCGNTTPERPQSGALTTRGRPLGTKRTMHSARRIWLVLAVTVGAVALLWTGLWFYAASAAETTIAGWREREAKVGRIYACERQTIAGFPFRIEVRCVD